MITAIYNLLVADATLASLLTGGVHNGLTVHEISRQNTPAAFDANKELKPCVLVKPETQTPWGPNRDSARLYVQLFFYQRFGYGSIEEAANRAYQLLHRARLTPAGGDGMAEILHADDLRGMEDQALGAAMITSRYVGHIGRAR